MRFFCDKRNSTFSYTNHKNLAIVTQVTIMVILRCDLLSFFIGGNSMNTIFNGLRTGFTPSAKVFEFRHPNDVITTVISNLLATTVVPPNDIDELVIVKSSEVELDIEYIKNATELVGSSKIIVKNELSLIDFLKKRLDVNTLLVIVNKADNECFEKESIIALENEVAFEEKVGIEISAGKNQRYWFEDYTRINTTNVFASNVVITLFFSKSNFCGELSSEKFDITLCGELKKESLNLNELVNALNIDYDWILEVDYLDYQNFLVLESALNKLNIHKKFEEPHSMHYGNTKNLNGMRALLSLYHKLANSKKSNGIVFIEYPDSWNIIRLQKGGE